MRMSRKEEKKKKRKKLAKDYINALLRIALKNAENIETNIKSKRVWLLLVLLVHCV